MRCPDCGSDSDGEAIRCGNCGYPFGPRQAAAAAAAAEVKTYLVPAAILSFLGWVVIGLPAVVLAVKTQLHLSQGDRAAALEASAKARVACWVGYFVVALVWGLQIAAFVFW